MKNLILTIATTLIVSCATPTKEYASLYDMFPKERELTLKDEVVISDPIFMSSGKGTIYKSHLIASVRNGNRSDIAVIDIKTGEVVQTLLPRGRGRNESVNAYLVGVYRDEIICYNEVNSSILRLKFDEIYKPTADQNWSKTDLTWDGSFACKTGFGTLSDDRYIFCGCREDGLFEVIDSQSRVLNTFGEYIEVKGDEVERTVPYDGMFIPALSYERMLYTSTRGNILYFYDTSDTDSEPKLLNRYDYDLAKGNVVYFTGGKSIGPDDDDLLGSISVTASRDCFYLLNSRTRFGDFIKASDYGSNTILVFDKDGKPIEKLISDRKLINIYYNQDDNLLYSIYENEDGDLVIATYK